MIQTYVPAKAQWYLNRLTSMSVDEVLYRIQQRTFVEFDKRSFGSSKKQSEKLLNVPLPSQFLNVGVGLTERDSIRQSYCALYPHNRALLIERADSLLTHQIELFGVALDLGETINWHRDPKTMREWPKHFWANIDIRDGQTIGGVKWVWELNRHHHLVTLSKAFYLTGDERYALEVLNQLDSWIANNPTYVGVNWTTSLEPAIRLINWVWSLAFLSLYDSIDASLLRRIYGAIEAQANYIMRYESRYSSANNHLIGEAAGLTVAGLVFPFLHDASKWAEHGLRILEREVSKQILPDGVPAEQAFHYLAFVLDFCLIAWRVAELNGQTVPAIWKERLEAAADFLCTVMDDAGIVPHVGDSDDAWVLRLDELPHPNNFCSLVTSAAILCKSERLSQLSNGWDEKNFWLFGLNEKNFFDELIRTDAPLITKGSTTLGDGGYAVLRAADRLALFDCGPLGYLSTAAHGHADALSLNLTLGSEPILVDPGTYAYQEGGRWREFLRSTRAHNTVVVEGADQSQMLGTFLWGQRATATLLQWDSNSEYDLVVAEHDGYTNLQIIHRRAVLFQKPDIFIVIDWILGEGTHQIEQLWHFAPQAEFRETNTQSISLEIRCNERLVTFSSLEGSRLKLITYQGNEDPIQGWASSEYGQIESAPVVALSGHVELPFRAVVAFSIEQNDLSLLNALKEKLLSLLQQ